MEQDPGWQFLRQSAEQRLAATTKKFDSKKNCWIADPEAGFLEAEIKSTKGDQVTVMTEKGEKTLKKDDIQQMNPPKYDKCEDMANLTFLNDASVLHNLKQRYYSLMIYTYSGLFCVVINPYKRLPIYTESICRMFIGKRRNEMPPHLFAVCDEAYRNMVNDHENQSMLITGESGAGKTENTKKSHFLFHNCWRIQSDQIVRTNPVLEAFGNAKTVRNNNSSRFGKFIRIHFNNAGKLAGGDIEHYLLEKSRVIKQASGERSYHIFYQIMSEGIPGLRKKLFLTRDIKEYSFVSQAEITIDGVDDKEEMQITDESFDILRFTPEEKDDLWALTAAIMHMGEMKFKQRPREEQAETESTEEAELAAKLFKVDVQKMLTAYLKPRVKVGTEWVNKGQNLEQVTWAIGAVAKALFARIFAWLIRKCNATLDAKDLSRDHFIGVLDIAGFEIFDLNSFEQLWINFVNERLQQFFNHHMFVLEQEEYKREGIKWQFIDFGLDLEACIELIEKPLGIISMLDEECIVPKATDLTLAQKLNDQHLGKHPNFQKPRPPKGKQAEAHFALVHYAGTVRYNVKAWLEKNKDPLNDTVVSVLKGNDGQALLSEIWSDYQTQEDVAANETRGAAKKAPGKKKGKSAAFATVSMLYRESLNKLMTMLNQTHPHFIRCIIPNEEKKAGMIEANLVLNQLTCNGVLEGIRICRKGFPNRINYIDFRQRYAILAADQALEKEPKKAGEKMTQKMESKGDLKVDDYQCGETKIFFRAGVLAHLEELRDEALSVMIAKFQVQCRYYLGQTEYKRRRDQQIGIKVIQRNVRSWCTLRTWSWFKTYNQVKPLIAGSKKDEEFEAKYKELEEKSAQEEKQRKELEAWQPKNSSFRCNWNAKKETTAEADERSAKILAQKSDVERQLSDMNEQLADMEDRTDALSKQRKKLETEKETLKKNVHDLEMTVKKQESERQAKDHQIRSLQDEIAAQDDAINKATKERKQQEEINRRLQDDLHAEQDKLNAMNKAKLKLEQQCDALEDSLEREKRQRADLDKQKRKIEGELRVTQENLEELARQKADMDQALKRQTVTQRLEDEQALVSRLTRRIKELEAQVAELQEELEAERQARTKAEKLRFEMQQELEVLAEQLDEAGGATQSQIEMNKKREAEMQKMRRDLEEANLQAENQLAAMRKKHTDAVAELSDQLDQLQKMRAKTEKEKLQAQREAEEAAANLDNEVKQRQNIERLAKKLESQLMEIQLKSDEQVRQLQELNTWKMRAMNENSDLSRQLEEAENQINAVNRIKSQLGTQIEDLRRQLDQESRERQTFASQSANYQLECQQLREALDEEQESKTELQRQISKANAEAASWRAKYEAEGLQKSEELEQERRKLAAKVQEIQEQLEQANQRTASGEKVRHRLQQELEDAQVDAERANSLANSLEKKMKSFDKVVDEWRAKCDSLSAELEAAQRDTRSASTEAFRLRTALDEAAEQAEALKRENKSLSQELKDINDQLGEGGRSAHELQKIRRRLELEKDELTQALEDAESALEAEESKLLRAQVETTQLRQEIEKRLAEKEEEFENTRRNHQRALESLQATLEQETRGRAELLRQKKKLESDIHDLEIGCDQANKSNADAQRTIRQLHDSIRDLQQQVDEEQRLRSTYNEQVHNAERRAAILQQEKEDLAGAAEQAERARRQAELERAEAQDTVNALNDANTALSTLKRKYEAELQQLQTDLNDASNEAKNAEERSRKASADAARLADELRAEQEHAQSLDRQRKAQELQLRDMQVRLDEAEAFANKGGKRQVAKLEARVQELQAELEQESHRHADTQKNYRSKERRCRELQFQVDEDKKSQERMYDLVEKLQNKIKTLKRQLEESEEIANANLQKYRAIQNVLQEAEERADMAENSLSKFRAKTRSASTLSVGGRGLMHSFNGEVFEETIRLGTCARFQLFDFEAVGSAVEERRSGDFDNQWHTFFTVRSTELRLNAGESSFPGGHRESDDNSAAATALRECYEEVGLEEKNVEVVGTFRPLISGHRLLLHAVLALQKDDWTPRLNTTEVQRCYWMPMRVFNSNENYLGPFDIMGILMHRFKYEKEQIVGLTANLAVMISMLLHQRLPPFKLSVQPLFPNRSLEEIAQRQFEETFQLLQLFERLDKKSKM
ncbi:Protein CBR-MYO-5 [Aphelenchoides besseyi]|nr:Protein CBR-MYO-5 [Aphelenchoides besseyi]